MADDRDPGFLIGRMVANVDNLTKAVSELNVEVKYLRRELNNINLFRAKVVGMSIGASSVVSVLSTVIVNALK